MKLRFNLLILALALFAVSAFAQTSVFEDENVEYTFKLPAQEWKKTVVPSQMSPNVEYVYTDRKECHLEIRKMALAKNTFLGDLIQEDEQKLQFLPGYVAGKEENFNGILRGTAFNYEFVRSGRNMSGRFYYLKLNDTTVYVLRFTGARDTMRQISNQTDSIASTFAIKKKS